MLAEFLPHSGAVQGGDRVLFQGDLGEFPRHVRGGLGQVEDVLVGPSQALDQLGVGLLAPLSGGVPGRVVARQFRGVLGLLPREIVRGGLPGGFAPLRVYDNEDSRGRPLHRCLRRAEAHDCLDGCFGGLVHPVSQGEPCRVKDDQAGSARLVQASGCKRGRGDVAAGLVAGQGAVGVDELLHRERPRRGQALRNVGDEVITVLRGDGLADLAEDDINADLRVDQVARAHPLDSHGLNGSHGPVGVEVGEAFQDTLGVPDAIPGVRDGGSDEDLGLCGASAALPARHEGGDSDHGRGPHVGVRVDCGPALRGGDVEVEEVSLPALHG